MLPLPDLTLVLCASPGTSCEQSQVMMARVRPRGPFELLSAAAWARVLGYTPEELSGTSLRALMQLARPAAGELVAALLEAEDVEPIEVTLRCKDAQRKYVRFHRRIDPYEGAIYVVADEA